jgi:hypothetical protein
MPAHTKQVGLLDDANYSAIHANRVTIMPKVLPAWHCALTASLLCCNDDCLSTVHEHPLLRAALASAQDMHLARRLRGEIEE